MEETLPFLAESPCPSSRSPPVRAHYLPHWNAGHSFLEIPISLFISNKSNWLPVISTHCPALVQGNCHVPRTPSDRYYYAHFGNWAFESLQNLPKVTAGKRQDQVFCFQILCYLWLALKSRTYGNATLPPDRANKTSSADTAPCTPLSCFISQ